MDTNSKMVKRASFKAGISASTFRTQREERAISISKEKRSIKTNSLRKKLNDPADIATAGANPSEMDMYKSLIFSDSLEQQCAGAVCFRKLLASDGNVPYDFILQPGIISRMCSFLSYRGDHAMDLLDETAWVLTNIACGGRAHVRSLIESHAVELLLEVLTINHPKAGSLREQALWALGNIAVDSGEARAFLIQKQIISSMLAITGGEIQYSHSIMVGPRDMEEPSMSAVKHIAWICSTLAGVKNDGPQFAALLEHEEIARPLVFMLTEFLQSPDNDVQAEAYNGLSILFEAPQKGGDTSSISHLKCMQWSLEEGILFKLSETLESDLLPASPPPPPPAEMPRPPLGGSPRPSPLRVDTLPVGQTVFTFNESYDSTYSTPDTTPGATDAHPFFPPPLSNSSRHGGKHVRRNSKEGHSNSPGFFRDSEGRNRTSSGELRVVPPLHLDPTILEPVEGFKSFTHSPGTGSSLQGAAASLGPIAAVMDNSAVFPLGPSAPVGEIDVIKNLFEKNGRSPIKNARQVATRSDNNVIKINMGRSAGYVRLNENPVKQSAIHTAAVLLSSSDVIQQQTVMLPRYDFLGKIVQLVAHDIQSSGNTRGLFVEPEAALTAETTVDMDIAEDEYSGNSNVGGNSSVVYDVMTCIVAVLRGTRQHTSYYLKQILSGHKVLDILEYFFGREHYETTLVTGEAFFLIVQELIGSSNDIVKFITLREHSMIYNRLLELMTISDVRFISCLLATLFDLLIFFDKLNNARGSRRSYDHFFQPIDRLHNLLNHPNLDVSNAAEKVEDLLEKLASRNNV